MVLCFQTALAQEGEQLTAQPEATRVSEIVEMREPNSKIYEMSDGTTQMVLYAEDIHYPDALGKLQDIHNTVVADLAETRSGSYQLSNEANRFTVRYGDMKDGSYAVRIEDGDYAVAFSPVAAAAFGMQGATMPAKAAKAEKADFYLKNTPLEIMSAGDDTVVYTDVFQNTDIAYVNTNRGVKEIISMKNPTGQNEFTFSLNLENVEPGKDEYGRPALVDEEGNSIFYIDNLFAVDANEEITAEIRCEMYEQAGGTFVKLTLDETWLNDSARAYPIILDPSWMITGAGNTYDSFVGSKSPNTNYNSGTNLIYLRTGRDSACYVRRSYIRFIFPDTFTSYHVASAYLRIKNYTSMGTPNIYAYRVAGSWDSNTITWNNKPAYVDSTAYDNHSDKAVLGSDGWFSMECRTIVRNWEKGTPNYGFCVKDLNENNTSIWNTLCSSDAASPNKPELVINFKDVVCWRVDVGNLNRLLVWTSAPSVASHSYDSGYSSQLASWTSNARTKWSDDGYPTTTGDISSADIQVYYGSRTQLVETAGFPADVYNETLVGYTDSDATSIGEESFVFGGVRRFVMRFTHAKIAITPQAVYGDRTTLHEFGHALGWIGHSSNSDDVMYYTSASFEKALTFRDTSQVVQCKP